MLGFCYHRLGMFRDAEKQLQSSMKQQPTIFGAMLLAKVWHAEPSANPSPLEVIHPPPLLRFTSALTSRRMRYVCTQTRWSRL